MHSFGAKSKLSDHNNKITGNEKETLINLIDQSSDLKNRKRLYRIDREKRK